MKMEPLKGGCLKIWLTETDMQHWGLCFDRMHARDETTRRAMLKFISLAQERHALRHQSQLTIEALPLDDGCLLLLSPADNIPSRIPTPTVYLFGDADALLHFGKTLEQFTEQMLPPASLYQWEQEYRLIVYAGLEPLPSCRRILSEFAQPITGTPDTVAYTEEHGKPLVIGNALHTLKASVSHAPNRSDPPH